MGLPWQSRRDHQIQRREYTCCESIVIHRQESYMRAAEGNCVIPKDLLSSSCRSSSFALLEAFAAKYWTSLGRFEWHRSFALAARTDRLGLYPLVVASPLRQTERAGPFFLALFTA